MNNTGKIYIAIFASGTGTNAQKIIDHFAGSTLIRVALIVSNKPDAGVLGIASRHDIPSLIIDKERFFQGNAYLPDLRHYGIGFIVLAGFLWKIPAKLIDAYRGQIINIHPALLPQYGGKGMYGRHVHESVLANKESESGITIHFVDEIYDHGRIAFQATCKIDEGETAASLAEKIHRLEHRHFPPVIEQLIRKSLLN